VNQDKTAAELLRMTEEYLGQDEDGIEAFVLTSLLDTHTFTPAQIVSYDDSKQTVSVQPAIRRLVVKDGRMIDLKPLMDVPLYFPGGAVTFPVEAGDDCCLAFGERCIDAWHAMGGIQDPSEFRHHDLSDAFAFVGFQSLPSVLAAIRTDGPELRTRDGSNRIALAGGMVFVGASTKSQAESMLELPILTNGVCVASAVDPFSELTGFVLGWSSLKVVAKK
jgi:hypothetical protein